MKNWIKNDNKNVSDSDNTHNLIQWGVIFKML